MNANDVLSIISFSDRAEIISPAEPLVNKAAVIGRLRTIIPSGGTEIYQGLSAGVKEMRQVELHLYTNHLILLTDGHTYGDDKQCLDLAKQVAEDGIGFTAFGIGADWNDNFLDRLVAPSGGQSTFIDQPADVVEKLQSKISGLGTIFAQNMRLKRDFPEFMSLGFGFKIIPFAQPLDVDQNEIKLGDVEGRSRLAFLLEINIAPQLVERRFNVPIKLVADIPAKQMQEQSFDNTIRLQVLKEVKNTVPPEAIVEAVRMLNLYRMNEKVWEEVEAGEIDSATRRMRHLTTRLLEAGESQLAQQANMEIDRITNAGTMSHDGRKKLKFGTRALINRTTYFDDDDDD